MAGTAKASKDAHVDRIHEIWLIGMAELYGKLGNLEHWRYYGELHQLKRRPLSTEWLEAVIAVAVAGRIRPARVLGYLKKLREKRAKHGQADQFEAFEGLVRQYLHPMRLTNHDYVGATFSDINHQTVWEQVRQHLSALSEQGYEVFLNSGTLLGVVRDKKLIDHDDDIDLALILKAKTAKKAAEEWRDLRGKLERLKLFDRKNFKDDPIYKLTPIGDTQIDLFPAWVEKGRMYVYPHTHGVLETKDVLPLRICELTGHALPANPEKMLEVNYGEGWKHPDPLFKFPWASANRAFEPFLKELRA